MKTKLPAFTCTIKHKEGLPLARTVGTGAKKPKKNKEITMLEKRIAELEKQNTELAQKLNKPKNTGEGK